MLLLNRSCRHTYSSPSPSPERQITLTRTSQSRQSSVAVTPLRPDIEKRIVQISDLIVQITPLIRDTSAVPERLIKEVKIHWMFRNYESEKLVVVGSSLERAGEQIGIDSQGTLWDYRGDRRLRPRNLAAMEYVPISKLHCNLIMLQVHLTHS